MFAECVIGLVQLASYSLRFSWTSSQLSVLEEVKSTKWSQADVMCKASSKEMGNGRRANLQIIRFFAQSRSLIYSSCPNSASIVSDISTAYYVCRKIPGTAFSYFIVVMDSG